MGWFDPAPSPTTKPRSGGSSSAGGWFGGGSGGGSSSGGGSGGSSGGGGSGGFSGGSGGDQGPAPTVNFKPKKTKAPEIDKALIRLAARLAILEKTKPKKAAAVQETLKKNLAGYTSNDVNQAAAKSGIPDEVTQVLRRYVGRAHDSSFSDGVTTLLDYVSRPGQAVAGALNEANSDPQSIVRGAWRGLSGQEQYSPAAGLVKTFTGQSKQEANKTVQGLPGPLKFGAELGAGIATDPTTYVSFGTTAGSKAAVDTAASLTAATRAAQAGRAFATADDVATLTTALRTLGKKALTKDEFNALGKGVKRGLRGAKGGVKVAGKTVVPGTVFEPVTDPVKSLVKKITSNGVIGDVERQTRTLPLFRQAERTGTVAAGTTERVAQALRKAQSAHVVSAEDWALLSKAGSKITDEGSRLRITAALEEPLLVAGLSDAEKKAFGVLDRVRREKTQLLVETGRLRGDSAIAAPVISQAGNESADARKLVVQWAHDAQAGDVAAQARLAQPADQLLQDAVDHVRQAGPSAPEVTSAANPIPTERYFPRVPSQASKDAGTIPGSPLTTNPVSLTGTKPKFTTARELPTKYTPTPSIIDKATGLPRFETDPFVATYKHSAQVNADVAKTRFIEDMRKVQGPSGHPLVQALDETSPELAKLVGERPVGTVIKDQVIKEVPIRTLDEKTGEYVLGAQRVLVDKALAHDPSFDRMMKVLADPAHNQDLLNFYDKTLRLWKSYATTFGPFSGGFGLRNFLGNQINGYWLTGTNPRWQITAQRAMRQLQKGIKEGDPWRFVSAKNEADLREAFSNGVIGEGFYAHDLTPDNLVSKLRNETASVPKKIERGLNPISIDNWLLKGGRKFNTGIEDAARLGLFMAKRRGGFTAESASSLVQKYLFDYGELANADRAIKHVVPFWTWTRKNVPLQLETLAKTPGAITAQLHALDALRSVTPGYNKLALPNWASQENAAVLPGGKSAYVPDLPITSAQDSLKPLQDLAQAFKAWRQGGPVDLQTLGRDTYLAAQPGGPFAGLPGALTQLATGKNVFSGAQTKPGQKVGPLDASLEQFIEQIAPFGPGIAKIRGVANKKTRTARGISGLVGVQTTPLNKQTMTSEEYRRLNELMAFATWLRQQGITIPTIKYAKTK